MSWGVCASQRHNVLGLNELTFTLWLQQTGGPDGGDGKLHILAVQTICNKDQLYLSDKLLQIVMDVLGYYLQVGGEIKNWMKC